MTTNLKPDEVIWYYVDHEDGSTIRHLASGPTEISVGGSWKRCATSFGHHPGDIPRSGAVVQKVGKRPSYLSDGWN
jgi:hypothetical protein